MFFRKRLRLLNKHLYILKNIIKLNIKNLYIKYILILKERLIMNNKSEINHLIEFVSEPTHIEIYSNFEDTEPLFFKIENREDYVKLFEVKIILPKDVRYQLMDKMGREFRKILKILPKRQEMWHIKLKYEGSKYKESENVSIIVKYQNKKGIHLHRVTLNPY